MHFLGGHYPEATPEFMKKIKAYRDEYGVDMQDIIPSIG